MEVRGIKSFQAAIEIIQNNFSVNKTSFLLIREAE